MKREIKYRCWVAGKMWRVYSLDFGNNKEIGTRVNVSNGGRLGFPLGNVELMQFTGIKDSNGKEIYDGDLIIADGYGPYRVFWDNDLCGWASCVYDDADSLARYKEIKIIGHIFDGTKYEGTL